MAGTIFAAAELGAVTAGDWAGCAASVALDAEDCDNSEGCEDGGTAMESGVMGTAVDARR